MTYIHVIHTHAPHMHMRYAHTIIWFILFFSSLVMLEAKPTVTIMLDPAGDATEVGRIINDSFERTVSLKLAHALKQEVEKRTSNTRIILSRFPGETLEPLQNASFANRLNVNLFIGLCLYPLNKIDTLTKQNCPIDIYYVLYHPVTDFWHAQNTISEKPLSLTPLHEAYVPHVKNSAHYAKQAAKLLSNQLSDVCPNAQVSNIGYPCKPLLGITSPAFLVEIGVKNSEDYQTYIPALTEMIIHSINLIAANE